MTTKAPSPVPPSQRFVVPGKLTQSKAPESEGQLGLLSEERSFPDLDSPWRPPNPPEPSESVRQVLSDAPAVPVEPSRDQGLPDAIGNPWSQGPYTHVRYLDLSAVPEHQRRKSVGGPAVHADPRWKPVGGNESLRRALGHAPDWTSAVPPVPRVTKRRNAGASTDQPPHQLVPVESVRHVLVGTPENERSIDDTIRLVTSYVPARSQLKTPRALSPVVAPKVVPGRTPEQDQVLRVVETTQWGGSTRSKAPETAQLSTVKLANGRIFTSPPQPPADEVDKKGPRRSAIGLAVTLFVVGVVWFISSFGSALNPRTVVEDYFSALEAGDIESAYAFEGSLSALRPVTNASYKEVQQAPSSFSLGPLNIHAGRASAQVSWSQGEAVQVAEVKLEREYVGPFKMVPQWSLSQGVMRPVVLNVVGAIDRDEPYELEVVGAEKPILVGPYQESTVITLPPGSYAVSPPQGDKYSNFGEPLSIDVTAEVLNAQSLTFTEVFND